MFLWFWVCWWKWCLYYILVPNILLSLIYCQNLCIKIWICIPLSRVKLFQPCDVMHFNHASLKRKTQIGQHYFLLLTSGWVSYPCWVCESGLFGTVAMFSLLGSPHGKALWTTMHFKFKFFLVYNFRRTWINRGYCSQCNLHRIWMWSPRAVKQGSPLWISQEVWWFLQHGHIR